MPQPPNTVPGLRGDTNAIFDRFGNAWIVYLNSALGGALPWNIVVGVSSDGGVNWKTAQIFNALAADEQYDYPMITFGGDGNGGWAVYVTAQYVTASGINGPILAYIPVSGLGLYGAGQIVHYNSLFADDSGQLASIVVSNEGKIFITGTTTLDVTSFGNTQTQMLTKLDGINNFVDGNINGYFGIQQLNIGWLGEPSWQAARLIQPNSTMGSNAYDNEHKILYLTWVDFDTEDPDVFHVYLAFSQNDGHTWSPRFVISDVDKGTRGNHSMFLDPVTHDLIFNWHDNRDAPTETTVRFFGAKVTYCQIKQYLDDPRVFVHPVPPVAPTLELKAEKVEKVGKIRRSIRHFDE